MKRIYLTLACIISIILIPCFISRAENYTAPNGNSYKYRYQVSWYRSRYYYLYSNIPFGLYTVNPNSYGQYKFGVVYNDSLYVDCDISMSNYKTISTGYKKYPTQVNTNVVLPEDVACIFDQNGNLPTNADNLWAIDANMPISGSTYQELYENLVNASIDFDNLYYDPTIPTPEFVVTMERPTPWENINTDTNFFDVIFSEYGGYYAQVGYKFSYPNAMKVGLVDGQKTYTPLTYANSIYYDICSLQDMQTADNLNIIDSSWFDLVSLPIQESESWQTSVPIWANNFNNSAYAAARNTWNTKMRYCWPLYGLRLEIFERLFYVADGQIYVGAWKHWNNTYPQDYQEEIPNNYQVGSSMPGYSNTSNNTDYQDLEYTQTSIGTQTGSENTPTVVVNNLTPNYPDYPTVATYNHDNILLQMIQTAKQLPQFFGDFSGFLAAAFVFIPSEIWNIIGFGFLCSIIVMIVKVL